MATQSLSPEKTRYARVCLAISDVCTKSLRDVLLRNVPSQDIKQAIVTHWGPQYNSPMLKKYPFSNLFPNQQLDPNFSVSDCDLSLLYVLIRNVSSVQKPLLGWGKCFVNNPQDTSIGANVERLHEFRNTVIHLKEPILSNQEFNSYWNKLRDCLTDIDSDLGGTTYEEKLEWLKTVDMDPDYANRLIESFRSSLQELQAGQNEQGQTLSNIREELNQGVDDIKTELSEVKDLIKDQNRKDQNRQPPQFATALTEIKSTLDNLKELYEQMKGKDKENDRTQPQLNSDQGVRTVNTTSKQDTNGGEEIGDKDSHLEGSLENLQVLYEVEVLHKGISSAEIDQTETVFSHEMLAKLAKSVGMIRHSCGIATGFRVGPNYVMTARHVIEPIIRKVPLLQQQQPQFLLQQQLDDRNMFIDFCYERKNLPCDPNLVFCFEPEIVYESVYLDTVILKLKPDIKVYPPPLTKFSNVIWDKRHGYLIGHSLADIKKTDKYQIVKPTKSAIDSAKKWSMNFMNEDGYEGIEDQHRVIFHCSFEKGAAGSPGFLISPSDGQAYVELMLLCGYPTWYYDKYQYKGNTHGIPNDFFVEQGVCIKSVYDDLKERDKQLCNAIFGTR